MLEKPSENLFVLRILLIHQARMNWYMKEYVPQAFYQSYCTVCGLQPRSLEDVVYP